MGGAGWGVTSARNKIREYDDWVDAGAFRQEMYLLRYQDYRLAQINRYICVGKRNMESLRAKYEPARIVNSIHESWQTRKLKKKQGNYNKKIRTICDQYGVTRTNSEAQ